LTAPAAQAMLDAAADAAAQHPRSRPRCATLLSRANKEES